MRSGFFFFPLGAGTTTTARRLRRGCYGGDRRVPMDGRDFVSFLSSLIFIFVTEEIGTVPANKFRDYAAAIKRMVYVAYNHYPPKVQFLIRQMAVAADLWTTETGKWTVLRWDFQDPENRPDATIQAQASYSHVSQWVGYKKALFLVDASS
jgi:hypothetical protein